MNHLLIITPEYFNSLSSLIINLLIFLTTIATLILTYLMYKVAFAALNTWRQQDKHNTIIELIKNAPSVNRTIKDLRNNSTKVIRLKKQLSIIDNHKITASEVINLKNQGKKIRQYSAQFEQIEQWASLSISNLEIDNSLRTFYVEINKIIAKIKIKNRVYRSLLREQEAYIQKYEALKRQIVDKKASPVKLPLEELILRKLDLDLKKLELDFNEKMELIKPYNSYLFAQGIATKDDLTKKIENLYKATEDFRDSYSNPKNHIR